MTSNVKTLLVEGCLINSGGNMNIGVIGYWFATNYGGVSSYYSLYSALEKMGHTPFLVENPYLNTDPEGIDVFSRNFFKSINARITRCYTNDRLNEINSLADTFVLGSDQVITVDSIKNFGKLFLMELLEENKKKIAISASCGGDDLNNPDTLAYARPLIKKFSAVSVRENAAKKIMKEKFSIDADLVVDPIFLTPAEQFEKIAEMSNLNPTTQPYMAAYVLDPTEDKKKCIKKISSSLELSAKIILDGRKFTHDNNNEKLGMQDLTLPELDLPQWLHYLKNSSFIFTDSFHGAAMAIILNKPFIMYANYTRGYPRFATLAETFDVKNRLVFKSDDITDVLINEKIDFNKINNTIQNEASKLTEWIKKALECSEAIVNRNDIAAVSEEKKVIVDLIKTPRRQNCVTAVLTQSKCVGCGSCVNSCPKNAVALVPDEWGYYRANVDEVKCIDCGLCLKKCPVMSKPENTNTAEPDCYEFINSNDEVLRGSFSGGAFSVLAKEAFRRNGVVVGAAWKNYFSVEHIIIDNEKDLPKLRKSKYLQSFLGNSVMKDVKNYLDEGRFVLFSGCPCQVAGLKSYLKKDYDCLIAIDVLCGNSPSPMFFKKFIKSAEKKLKKPIKSYEFRHKSNTKQWDALTVKITDYDGDEYTYRGSSEDDFQRVYHNHTMCPPHCEKCEFQKSVRYGDITIGDFWGIEKRDSDQKFEYGVSALIVNNSKGNEYIHSFDESDIRLMKKVPYSWVGGNGLTANNKNYASPQRDEFYKAILKMDFDDAANYALKPNHGQYNSNFSGSSPLAYNVNQLHFKFDSSVWEEHFINGSTVLITKPINPPGGKFAIIPLNKNLISDKEYHLYIKFKIKTNDKIYNFHVKDSGSNIIKIIYSHHITPENADEWVEINTTFTLKSDIFDEFMIGAAQLKGSDAFIKFDSILIY